MFFSTIFIFVITLLNVIVYYLRQIQEEEEYGYGERASPSAATSSHVCRRFSLAEIKLATHDFDESLVIGKGGFGKVYKGSIDDGASLVAIKRLDMGSKQGAPEFWTEIEMLSKFRHSHLVALLGYCEAHGEMLLVYEYMPGGTLADHLHKFRKSNGSISPLSWVQRLKICIGAARGLEYLHTGTGVRHRVIHRDVKSSNILLDENLAAKISDFGLSRIGPANQDCTTDVYTNRIQGTFGYIDPEYFLTHRLTRKSDVYAFGVVLFEVLCGRPALDFSLDEEQHSLAQWAKHCSKEGKIDQILDSSLVDKIEPNCLKEFVGAADKCLLSSPKDRPTMAEVVAKLELALTLQTGMSTSVMGRETVYTDGANDHYETIGSSGVENFSSSEDGGTIFSSTGAAEHQVEHNIKNGSSDGLSSTPYHIKRPKRAFISKVISLFSAKVPNFSVIDGDKTSDSWPFNFNTKRVATDHSSNANLFGDSISAYKASAVLDFLTVYGEGSRYRIEEVIGKGISGVVFSAYATHLAEKVAIKKINDIFEHVSDATRTLREIKLLRLLHHPDIVEIKHILMPPSRWEFKDIYVVFELMESDLHEFIKANHDLTQEHYQYFLYQLLRGLKYIHAANVFHRDLKPKNILANANRKIKICDFGIARVALGDTPTAIFWTDYVAARWYRAPELCGSFFSKYTTATDIWSIGCIFAELLTGKPLFCGKNVAHQLDLITDLLGTPPPDAIARIRNEKARRYLGSMRKKRPVPFSQKFPNANPLALRLLERMLAFEPKFRPSAEEALSDPYFKDLPKVECEPSAYPVNKVEFEFEDRKLTKEDVRELIYREILEYHPKMLKEYLNGIEPAGVVDLRLRHTFKGYVESVVRLKGLEIETIEQAYSV